MGVKAAWEPPTHNFDKTTLTSMWSHKSMANITGLGSFGLHQMIITDTGCAGRLGSLVINAAVTPTPKREKERCFYYIDGSCSMCVESCPVGALTVVNKKKCWQHILEIDRRFSYLNDKYKLTGPFDVCGKCATGPCSII
jgi:epoxyqueuosine reductase QueG